MAIPEFETEAETRAFRLGVLYGVRRLEVASHEQQEAAKRKTAAWAAYLAALDQWVRLEPWQQCAAPPAWNAMHRVKSAE